MFDIIIIIIIIIDTFLWLLLLLLLLLLLIFIVFKENHQAYEFCMSYKNKHFRDIPLKATVDATDDQLKLFIIGVINAFI